MLNVTRTSLMLLYLIPGALTVGLVRQCQTIHGRDRTCIPPRLPPEWVTTLFFIIMGIISLTVTCGLLVASHWRREATKYARWIAFTGSEWRISCLNYPCCFPSCPFWSICVVSAHQWCPSELREFFQLTIPKLLPLGRQKLQTSPLGLIHGA